MITRFLKVMVCSCGKSYLSEVQDVILEMMFLDRMPSKCLIDRDGYGAAECRTMAPRKLFVLPRRLFDGEASMEEKGLLPLRFFASELVR